MNMSPERWARSLSDRGSILKTWNNCVDRESWKWYSPDTHVVWISDPASSTVQISAYIRCKLWAVHKVGVPFKIVEEVLDFHEKISSTLFMPECAQRRKIQEGRDFTVESFLCRANCHVCRTEIIYSNEWGVVHCPHCDAVVWRCACKKCST